MDWTPDRTARLRELWDEPYSCDEIAVIMSKEFRCTITKNAIIGKSHRLNLPVRDISTMVTPRVREPAEPDGLPGVSLLALRDGQCRWPLDTRPVRYCGEPIVRRAYCAAHAKLAYNREWVR